MYPKYFGLKEPSFSIAPDPHYLFLSEQHKEALAHLLYGAGESGGFVLLTGEVGTGKTTVCRAFLEQLPEGVDVALILNPAQSANELLTNVCDEFRIPLPKGKLSNKMLIDRLNEYLLATHASGRRPLLIIDEAQNLLPQALEQIRLLTNLETTKHKLLQIFLVGQPELRRMLDRDRLRQLNQRITARFHLRPFTLKETADYIRHRVAVAGVDRPLFSARAIRHIYKFSGGIPRLINILCDRALLGVCVTRGSQVTPAIVATAAREVRGEASDERRYSPIRLAGIAMGSFGLAAVIALVVSSQLGLSPLRVGGDAAGESAAASAEGSALEEAGLGEETPPSAEGAPAGNEGSSVPDEGGPGGENAVAPESSGGAAPGVLGGDTNTDGPGTADGGAELAASALPEADAMRILLKRWGLELGTLGSGDPCARVAAFGLGCEPEEGRLSNVRFFDLPALMEVEEPDGANRYIVLGELGAAGAMIDLPDGSKPVAVAELERAWTGRYTLVWQLPPGGAGVIGVGSSGEDVVWLRDLLGKVPGIEVPDSDSAYFDAALANALRAFQASKGLTPDGVAGPRTFIMLLHAAQAAGVPSLANSAEEAEAAP